MKTLAFQASCIRDLLSAARNDEIREGLEAAIATIELAQKRDAALRTLAECVTFNGSIQCDGYIGADNDRYE